MPSPELTVTFGIPLLFPYALGQALLVLAPAHVGVERRRMLLLGGIPDYLHWC